MIYMIFKFFRLIVSFFITLPKTISKISNIFVALVRYQLEFSRKLYENVT